MFKLNLVAIVALGLLVVLFLVQLSLPQWPVRPERANQLNVLKVRQWLKTLNKSAAGSIPCRWVVIAGVKIPMCTYRPIDDVYVSAAVAAGSYFESRTVETFLRVLRDYPDVQLVDIGANIGSYTLPAGRVSDVLAIEPNWQTITRLAMSVAMGNMDDNITLVHNAISNKRAVARLAYDSKNRGDTFLADSDNWCNHTIEDFRCFHQKVETVYLNDLLPLMKKNRALLKIDVQGHEIKVFTEETAGIFFDQIDVPVVLMEWQLYGQYEEGKLHQIEQFLNFFYRRTYKVYDENNQPLEAGEQWPLNIILKKSSFTHQLFS